MINCSNFFTNIKFKLNKVKKPTFKSMQAFCTTFLTMRTNRILYFQPAETYNMTFRTGSLNQPIVKF